MLEKFVSSFLDKSFFGIYIWLRGIELVCLVIFMLLEGGKFNNIDNIDEVR